MVHSCRATGGRGRVVSSASRWSCYSGGARPAQEPPDEFLSEIGTAGNLQGQGFLAAKVVYRIGASQDIVVVYDGGGSPDPIEAIGKIERTVWLSEPYGFDNLVVQNADQAPIIRSYAELEAALGPRQPGFAGVTLRQGALLTGFGNVAERISIGIVVAFAAAIAAALVAIAMIVFAGLRPTRTLAPDDLTNRRST